jgi:lipopolysaccharide export system ATP-binding protein
MSVRDNILSVLQMTKFTKKQQHERTDKLLEEFSLTHIAKEQRIHALRR